jgi:2-keto-3-deoxy-L-rhamnonate aldolase RhmA
MTLRHRIQAGQRLVGTVLALPEPALAELAAAPFDLVWLDMEHGALDVRDVQALTIAVQGAGCAAAVRLPRWDCDRLAAVLDAGVDSIVVPAVESADQAGDVTARLRYPPAGRRGYGPRRAGRSADPAEPACLVQIETPAGVAAAHEIARVPGVDALVVGCADLSFAVGAPLELDGPELRAAAAEVRDAARATGTAFGVAGSGDQDELAAHATLIVHSVDVRIYAQAMEDLAARLEERHARA